MKKSRRYDHFIVPLVLLFVSSTAIAQTAVPPVAAKRPFEMISHGDKRIDNYYWMRERENPDVITWLESENAYLDAVMSPTKSLQNKLVEELKTRIKQDDESVPYPERQHEYFSRTTELSQYPVHFRRALGRNGERGPEEIVIDVNKVAEGHEYCSVGGIDPSANGRLIAWAVDFIGRRKYTIQFLDMETGRMLEDKIPETTGNMVWAEDNATVFYSRQDPETLRADRIYAHRLGSDPANDRLVYTEEDQEFACGVASTRSRKFIQIISRQTLSSECRLIDAHNPDSEPIVFLPREKNHEYSVDHLGDRFVVRTNWNASNFRILESRQPGLDKSAWTELLPHSADVFVEEFTLLDHWLVVQERCNGLTRIRFRKNGESSFQTLDFGEACYSANMSPTSVTNTDTLRYVYSSMKTPDSTYEYDLNTNEKSLLKQEEILGGFSTDDYVTERLWATAEDGVKVPIGMLRHKNTPVDGTAPCLVYGYGSYGVNEEDEFDPTVLNLVNRGFVYAIVHIRGGQEMGRHWYEDGKLLKKKNTFTDFIACTRQLVSEKYADPKRVYARGGSAGGLLMGAVANMAPDLYHGMIADVPFVDVVTTMLDATIPLTTSEYDEWGNPNEKEYYDYMLSYSPYDQVKTRNYPNILVTTGLHDSQVQYFEPAKWVARLRELKTDNNILLLHTKMEAGHGGSTGRYDRYKEAAMRQAFLLMLAGIDE